MSKCKPCQADQGGVRCEMDARAKCFHCSRDLCLMHFTEHSQLLESQSRSVLRAHGDVLENLYSRLESLSITSRILEHPFIQLEKWRIDAHTKLDQLAEQKRQEIEAKIADYRTVFVKKNHEQMQKIDQTKKKLHELSRKTHVASKDIKILADGIEEIQTYLQSLDTHTIQVSACSFSVNIRTQFFDSAASRSVQPPSSRPPIVPPSISKRDGRSELKDFMNYVNQQRLFKKRSVSVSLS